MAKLPLVFLGNAALRRVSKRVAEPRSAAVKALLANMEAQVRKEDGVGIAAPQLGQNQRMFLMLKDTPTSEDELPGDGEENKFEYQECINPEILQASEETAKDFEGCLSIPGYVGVVRRALRIDVQFTDAHGATHRKTLQDFPARIFQHELDHLDGVLYIDRMEKDSLIHDDEFRKLERADYIRLLRD